MHRRVLEAALPGHPNGGGSDAEKEYTQYLARLLGVSKSTTRAAVLAEVGLPPLWAAGAHSAILERGGSPARGLGA